MTVSTRTMDILIFTGRQLSGRSSVDGLFDNALKGSGDQPKGYVYAAEVCRADIVDGDVVLTPILIVGSNAVRITPARIARAYRERIGAPITHARVRLYGQI